jgi:hypothetical protein
MFGTGLGVLAQVVLSLLLGAVVVLVVGHVLTWLKRRRDCRSLFERIRSRLFPPLAFCVGGTGADWVGGRWRPRLHTLQEVFDQVEAGGYWFSRDLFVYFAAGSRRELSDAFIWTDRPKCIRDITVEGPWSDLTGRLGVSGLAGLVGGKED